jgi:hypothetical protein
MSRRALVVVALVVALLAALVPSAWATFPFRPGGGDVYDYSRFKIANGECEGPLVDGRPAGSDLPSNFHCVDDFKLTSRRVQTGDADYLPSSELVRNNPQELLGVRGSSTNLAWETTTGRPDTIIAVTDSGIRWDEARPNLVNKYFLNRGELPRPSTGTIGGTYQQYDANADGVVNVKDWTGKATDLNANGLLDPSDLIRTFSNGVDDDGNGYVDDISGWDFFEGDNDPNDDVDYGHGTGESEDSAGETEIDIDPQCPNCMLMEMRVGDSFVADVNHFAEAAIYATDNGASVIQSALGTLNNSGFAQRAADYAYERGVLFMASEADESAGHHNMPSALNHTLLANSVTKFVSERIEQKDYGINVEPQEPRTYLAFNGCTNFGGYSWVSVESTSCSSDAIGQSSGIAGLLYSAARNAVQKGDLVQRPDTAGRPLSAEEAKQLFRLAADDIDFSTPKPPFGPPNNFATSLPASQRFVTTKNWDQVSGWGRLNAQKAVELVAAGTVPPEADIVSPRWWQTLPVTGSVDVKGEAAAPRLTSGTFTYQVQFAPGVQAGCPAGCPTGGAPASETWTPVFTSAPRTTPLKGTLATLDMAAVRAAIDLNNLTAPAYNAANDPTSREMPEQDAFRVRVLTCIGTCPADPDYDPTVAIEQRQYFARADGTLLPGWPKFLDGDGAGSATFDDLDGDNVDEMVIADGNGLIHAYQANGSEAAGWPVHTLPIPLPTTGANAYRRGDIATPVYGAILTGTPAIADLDGDGSPEVSAGDIEGNLYVWTAGGTLRSGFPVRGNPAFSEEPGCHETTARPACDDASSTDVRDELNNVDRGFTSHPAAADLDPSSPGLELVIGSNDGHVYAFRADGAPVPGWPVLLRDPLKVQSVDPITHKVVYVDDSAKFGRKVISTPSVGDVDGDGDLEVAVNVNEEYEETPNVSPARALSLQALSLVNPPGNTRTYLLHHDGTNHPKTADQVASAHPDDQAYVAGWPVRIAMAVLEHLPYVGEGSDGSPVLADVDDDGKLEILTASIAGPPYALNDDGTSVYPSGPDGSFTTMAIEKAEAPSSAQTDFPAIAALGGGVVGRLAPSAPLSFAMGAAGLLRLLDVVLPEQQLGAQDHLGVWDTTTGSFSPGFPTAMNDLQFFNTPAIADVTGDGLAEVLQSSAMYDLRAYGAGGVAPAGWPKFTGGWSVASPGTGDLNGDGLLDVALPTREGNLFVWGTQGDACQAKEWPKFQGNLRNTGTYGLDAKRPGKPTIVSVDPLGTLLARPSGGDGVCGTATSYRVRIDGVDVNGEPAPASPGTLQLIEVGKLPAKFVTVTVQTVDAAGNVSFPATLGIDNRPPGSGGAVDTLPVSSGSSAAAPAAGEAPARAGYRMVATDGGIFSFGGASFEGSTGDLRLNKPIIGMAQTPSKRGYWLGASDGGIFTFGDAVFHGSAGALPLNKPVVGMAATPSGGGYWLVASDGGIFTFGNAGFFGSTGDLRLNQPIVGMAPTPTGRGYWLVAADGGIFSFGDAAFYGSTGDLRLNKPIVGIAATPFGKGYRFVATDGGIFAFGDAGFFGSTGSLTLNQPIVGMENTATGAGYWLVAADGGVFTFGDAPFLGSTGDLRLNKPIVGIDGG